MHRKTRGVDIGNLDGAGGTSLPRHHMNVESFMSSGFNTLDIFYSVSCMVYMCLYRSTGCSEQLRND